MGDVQRCTSRPFTHHSGQPLNNGWSRCTLTVISAVGRGPRDHFKIWWYLCIPPQPLARRENARGPPVAIPGFQKHSWIQVTKVHCPWGCPVLHAFRTRDLELQRLVQSRSECLGVKSTFLYTLESIRDDPREQEVSQAGKELRGGIHSMGNARGQQSEEDRTPKSKELHTALDHPNFSPC